MIIGIFIIGLKFYNFSSLITNDSVYYLIMSYHPLEITAAPYTYRILTPFLIHFMPFNNLMNFIFLNLIALISSSILLYYYLKRLNFRDLYCFVGVLFFILGPGVLYCMDNVALVDPLSFLLFLTAFYSILCKNDKLFIVSMFLGLLNKEVMLFILPLYFLCKLERDNFKTALKSTTIIIIPLLTLLITINFYFGFQNHMSLPIIKEIILYQITSNNIESNFYLTFGVIWIIAIYSIFNNNNKFLKKAIYILPILFLQIFFATDSLRTLNFTFPVIIPLSLYVFKIKNKKIILFFILLSVITLISYLIVLNTEINSYLGFLLLPLPCLITIILIIILINLLIKNK